MKAKTVLGKVEILKNNSREILSDPTLTHGLARLLRRVLKEVVLYKNHMDGAKKWRNDRLRFGTKKIQIGGGAHLLKGFLNIDIVPPADVVFDVREGLPLPNGCSEFIFSEHFFEHIDYPLSAKKFINECFRVLKKKGRVVIGVPDSELIVNNYVKKDRKFYQKMLDSWYSKRNCLEHFNTYIDLLNYHFRDQDDDGKYNPHFWAYDFGKLESLLKDAGFTKVERWKFDATIANPKREWGSIYIVGTK